MLIQSLTVGSLAYVTDSESWPERAYSLPVKVVGVKIMDCPAPWQPQIEHVIVEATVAGTQHLYGMPLYPMVSRRKGERFAIAPWFLVGRTTFARSGRVKKDAVTTVADPAGVARYPEHLHPDVYYSRRNAIGTSGIRRSAVELSRLSV